MVGQEDNFGCGVAGVANLLGISYQNALELFDAPEQAKNKGFLCHEIVAALEKAGVKASYSYVRPKIRKLITQNGTIVFIARNKKYPAGHYLLRSKGGWIDSWINFPAHRPAAGMRERLPGRPIYAVFPVQ